MGADLGGDLGGDMGGDIGGATGSGMTLDDVAIELIRAGKREEARVVLQAAAGNGSGPIESPDAPLGGAGMGDAVPPAPEAGAPDLGGDIGGDIGAPAPDMGGDEGEPAPPAEGGEGEDKPEKKDSDSKDDSKDNKKDDKKDDDTEKVKKSDEMVTDDMTGTFAASSDGLKETVGKIMGEAVSSIMDALDQKDGIGGPDGDEHHGHGPEIEIEVESEDKNEEIADHPFEKEEDELCKCAKSAVNMTFMDYVMARRNGADPIGDYFAKSDAEEMETSPFAGSGKAGLFQKSMGIFDDLTMVADKSPAQKREEGISEELGEQKGMGGSAASRGEVLDDIDAKKPATTTSREEGLLDENDAGGRSAGSKSPRNDMVDDLDEKKGMGGSAAPKGEMLDDVDEMKKSADDLPGKPMMSFAELVAMKKAERPPASAGFDASRLRPDLGSITKSATPSEPIQMGHGVDPAKVVEKDWEEYKLYKAQRRI